MSQTLIRFLIGGFGRHCRRGEEGAGSALIGYPLPSQEGPSTLYSIDRMGGALVVRYCQACL